MIFISFAREIKEWVEYFIARIPGRLGNNVRNFSNLVCLIFLIIFKIQNFD